MPSLSHYDSALMQRATSAVRMFAFSYLDGYRVNCGPNFKAPLFEHHHRRVVDAGSC